EGRADVGHLLYPGADRREVGIGLDPARGGEIDRTRLVPIDAVGANDVVERPALRGEALGGRRTLRLGQSGPARGHERRAGSRHRDRTNEMAAIHGDPSVRLSMTGPAMTFRLGLRGLRPERAGRQSRSLKRWILPVAVRGRSSRTSIQRGYFHKPARSFTWVRSASNSASSAQ